MFPSITKESIQSNISVTPFGIEAKKYDSTIEYAFGLWAYYTYVHKQLYCRIDTAFAQVGSRQKNERFSRTHIDDILFSIGYCKAFKKTRATISLIFGFPTHEDLTHEGIQFGIGHYGAGFKIDGVYLLSEHHNQMLLAAGRWIRLLPSTLTTQTGAITNSSVLDLGNLIDILVGYTWSFGLNGIEIGYNPEILTKAKLCPPPATPIPIDRISSYIYGAYYRGFLREKHAHILSLVFVYGFEHKPKIYKHFIFAWATWTISW